MSEARTIIRIMPLTALLQAIARHGRDTGRYPTRISACAMQVSRWKDDLEKESRWVDPPSGPLSILAIMGIPVVEGADDLQPELIWAARITEAAQ